MCLLWSLLPLGSTELKPLQGKVITGLYHEEIPGFVPYTKVAPLLFEFKLRPEVWKVTTSAASLPSINNAFQILPRLNCRSDMSYSVLNTVDWYFTCPVFYHLHQFLQKVKINYTDIYPISPSFSTLSVPTSNRPVFSPSSPSFSSPSENQKFSNSKVKFEDCESELDKSWKGVNARERDTGCSTYKGHVEKCSSIPAYSEIKNADDYTGYFDRMQSNFVSTFFLNSSDPGELVNNLLALQTLQIHSIYAELTRVREALLSCQNNMIPQSFVKSYQIENALKELRPKLLKMQYALSIQSALKIFRLPIADCIFTGTSLIVQILLPVIRTDVAFTLLKVHSPIFLYENRLCKVSPEEKNTGQFIYESGSPTKYCIYEKTSNSVYPSPCTPGETELCFIPDQSGQPLISRCLTSVMNQSIDNIGDIRTYCSLECERKPLPETFSKLIIPIIQRISSSKFVVAVNRVTSLLIKCVGKPDEMVTPQEYGAVEISLACGCHLMWHAENFEARVPCANSVMVRHVVPEHMLNQSGVSVAMNKFFLISNLGDRINSSLIQNHADTNEDFIFEKIFVRKNGSKTDLHIEPGLFSDSLDNTSRHSLSVLNSSDEEGDTPNRFSYYKGFVCYDSFTHTYLWIAVGIETTLFLGIAVHLYYRIRDINTKWEIRDTTSVTYSSAAQLTSAFD